MTTETLELLRRERDEARASVVALWEALTESLRLLINNYPVRCVNVIDEALSDPNPGQPLLDRLAAAEAVANTTLAHQDFCATDAMMRCMTVDEAIELSKPTLDAQAIALAAWRKLTEEAK